MENFDRIWGLVAVAVPMAMGLVSIIVAAVNKPNISTTWGKIQLIIGRVFSFSTYGNAGNKQGFEFKLPVIQSADPRK